MALELGGFSIPESALTWRFVKASGPGGQNVNKVSTAAECRLHLARAGLPEDVRWRLAALAGSRLNSRGEVVLFAETHRSQARNRADALNRLSDLVAAARRKPKRRIASGPSRAQKARRREEKRRRAEVKRARRPPGGEGGT